MIDDLRFDCLTAWLLLAVLFTGSNLRRHLFKSQCTDGKDHLGQGTRENILALAALGKGIVSSECSLCAIERSLTNQQGKI